MIRTVLFGIILLFLQIFKSGSLTIGVAQPNFLIAYAIFLGWVIEEKWAFLIAFIVAVAYDLIMPQTLGLNAVLLVLICWLTMLFHNHILLPKVSAMFLLALFANLIYYFFFGIFYLVLQPELLPFLTRFLYSTIYNSFITLLFFYLLILFYKLHIDYSDV